MFNKKLWIFLGIFSGFIFSFNVSANSFRYNQRIIKTVQNYDGKQHQLVEDFSDYDLDAKKINGFTFDKSILSDSRYCYFYTGNLTKLYVRFIDDKSSLIKEITLDKISVGGDYKIDIENLDSKFEILDSSQLSGMVTSENQTININCIQSPKDIISDKESNEKTDSGNATPAEPAEPADKIINKNYQNLFFEECNSKIDTNGLKLFNYSHNTKYNLENINHINTVDTSKKHLLKYMRYIIRLLG